jgi:hypothetical protein
MSEGQNTTHAGYSSSNVVHLEVTQNTECPKVGDTAHLRNLTFRLETCCRTFLVLLGESCMSLQSCFAFAILRFVDIG